MANTDAPFGLRPVNNAYGTAPTIREYEADTARHIYQGQLVNFITGTAGTADKVEGWDGSTATLLYAGVAAHYLASTSSDRKLLVYTDMDQEYEIQVDDDSLADNADFVGVLFDVVNGDAGSSTTLQSTAELDGDSGTATHSNAVYLQGVRKVSDPDVDYSSANPRVIVKIHPLSHAFGGDDGVAPGA